MVALIRRGAHDSGFSRERPTRWYPDRVQNPDRSEDPLFAAPVAFTEETAWPFILKRLERGEYVQVVALDKPPGRKGFVMKIDLGSDVPKLYVKLQLGSGIVWGRSFHYDQHE